MPLIVSSADLSDFFSSDLLGALLFFVELLLLVLSHNLAQSRGLLILLRGADNIRVKHF
jgi:hypothetical protein